MPLLNYTTSIEASKTASQVEDILVKHGARQILKEYEDVSGQLQALSFIVPTPNGNVPIRLPIDPEAIKKVLNRQRVRTRIDHAQCVRIAWRIVKDWVEAQMALLETEMVKMEQIFLPYVLIDEKKTLYQAYTEHKLLGQGTTLDAQKKED